MNYTTTTAISRAWSKAFENINYATVLNNNNDIWMIIGWDLYKTIIKRWIIEDLMEDIEMEKNEKKLKAKYQKSSESGVSKLVI